MEGFRAQADRTARLLQATPGWQAVQALLPDYDSETVEAVLREAAAFAATELAPLNAVSDRHGCRIVEGRVKTPAGFAQAYRRYAEAGWLGMDLPEAHGGQGLPLTLQAACLPLFERGCVSMMMAAGSSRAACHLLAAVAEPALAEEWISQLLAGEWTATICISEPDAGSDVGRIRTTAAQGSDSLWQVNGVKSWISFGDHDLAARIGHCLLARTGKTAGTAGLSLFLVPDRMDGKANGITVQRIEEKMGLHGSPTCILGFDGARGWLLGEEGRGLHALFHMIELMRLQTGCQGLGLASASADIAEAYAQDRKQGGPADRPPVPIAQHPDVRRQLSLLRRQTEVTRAAILESAARMDLARLSPDEKLRADMRDFSAFMLPMIKTFGAEAGFEVSNRAIQVMGAAGYTKEWPVEQHLRDSRVMTIYEGTTGIQAIDFLTRRLWRDQGRGLAVFKRLMREGIAAASADRPAEAAEAEAALASFLAMAAELSALQGDPEAALYRAEDYMRCAWAAVTAWMALRLD